MRYEDITRATRDSNYVIHIDWDTLLRQVDRYVNERQGARLELMPDFQRGHVWTEAQQLAYVEAKLSGRVPNDMIRCNCIGWGGDFRGPFVLVDGLQRLTAATKFLRGELRPFGHTAQELGPRVPSDVFFLWTINALPTRAAVLQWYIELNSGGTPHSRETLDMVRELLAREPRPA